MAVSEGAEPRMIRVSSSPRRACALALLLLPVVAAGLVACGDDTVAGAPDGGGSDATVDGSVDSPGSLDSTAEAQGEASCAVDAGPLDDAEVALGQQLTQTHKCQDCHGQNFGGNNDGVVSKTAEGGTAYPPNLTPDPATGLGCWTNAQIENAILNGVDNQGMLLCNPMPVFGHIDGGAGLDPMQAQAVVEFLRSLPIVVNQVPDTPACPVPEAGPPAEGGPDGSADSSGEGGDSGGEAALEAGPDGTLEGGD